MKNSINLNDDQMDVFGKAAVQYNIEKQLRNRYDKILSDDKYKPKNKGKTINLSSIIKVAAVVVAVLGSMFLIQESIFAPSTQSIAQNFLDNTKISGNPNITRKGANTATQIQREANDAFTLKNYTLAVSKYSELLAHNKISILDQFYLGISHLKTENYAAASSLFLEIKNSKHINIEEVDWFLSLSYILSLQEEKAIPILEKIILEKKYKSKEAEKLLNKIR